MRTSFINRKDLERTLLLPGFELSPVTPKRKLFVPVWSSCLDVIRPKPHKGLFSFGVHKIDVSGCYPSEMGGEKGLFGKDSLRGILCAPYPKCPISRRVLEPVLSDLLKPHVRAVFFAMITPRALRFCRETLANALKAPLSREYARKIAGNYIDFVKIPLFHQSFDNLRGIGTSIARSCWPILLRCCRFLASGSVPFGGVRLRRRILGALLWCLLE